MLVWALVALASAADGEYQIPMVLVDEARLATQAPSEMPTRPEFVELPAQRVQHVLTVPVVLGHREAVPFIVDTGAQLGLVADDTLTAIGLPADTGTPFGAIAGSAGEAVAGVRLVGLDRVDVGGRVLIMHPITVADLDGLNEGRPGAVAGILGHPELAGYVVEFDAAHPAVRWYSPDAFADRRGGHPWRAVPASFEREIVPDAGPSLVYVDVVFDGVPARLLVDTGCSDTAITAKVAREAGIARGEAAEVIGIDGDSGAWRGRGRLDLGGLVQEVPVLVVDAVADGADGRLCMDRFQDRQLVVDYPGERVLLSDPALAMTQ